MYRMKQFAAMTGMTQSKIRFYEKHGLVLSDRMENGYRVFTPEDAFRSNAFRVLLQYGFSISEAIEMLDAKQDTAEFRQSLQEQQDRLDRERVLLEYRQRRIASVLDVLESDGGIDFKIVSIPDQLYVNASHGRDFTVSLENEKLLAEYYELLSITSCARIISRENLLDESPAVDPDYINIASVEERHFLSDYAQQRVKRLELGRCVRFRRTVTREESVRKETFDDLFAYLKTHNLAIRGDILIMPMFLNLDGEGCDIEVLYVPIEKREGDGAAHEPVERRAGGGDGPFQRHHCGHIQHRWLEASHRLGHETVGLNEPRRRPGGVGRACGGQLLGREAGEGIAPNTSTSDRPSNTGGMPCSIGSNPCLPKAIEPSFAESGNRLKRMWQCASGGQVRGLREPRAKASGAPPLRRTTRPTTTVEHDRSREIP
ncbi:MerR family transcriptional regulator [Adlercreutzia mucosicola]|uniref:MerR family transcriptional regulator n=1 Tax=Adlercreutzia mucosicola TaxID=580026 RepID=UPI001F1762DC|nr:MerR family transcriptional regulator [Adlercreutzia mucosicola]